MFSLGVELGADIKHRFGVLCQKGGLGKRKQKSTKAHWYAFIFGNHTITLSLQHPDNHGTICLVAILRLCVTPFDPDGIYPALAHIIPNSDS